MKSICILCEEPLPRDSRIVASREAELPRRRPWLRRIARFSSWLGPGAVLALIPKCPACLAAYISVGTGIGVSLSVAENLRVGLTAFSIATLSWLSFRLIRACIGRAARAQES